MNSKYAPFGDKYVRLYDGRKIKNITFIVTHDCSMRCTYCYEHNKSNERMSLETAKKLVDLMFEEDAKQSKLINDHDAHGVILDFIGGEPLLEIDLIENIMHYFLSQAVAKNHRWATNYMISICSNGLAYHTEKVQRFFKKYAGRVSRSITIDGCKECHDACRFDVAGNPTYDRVADAVKKARLGSTKFTLAPDNIQYLYDASINLYENLGMEVIHCNCVFEEGWELSHAKVLYGEMVRLADYLVEHPHLENSLFSDYVGKPLGADDDSNWCGGTGAMLAFDVDGRIYPCLRYAPMSTSQDPFVIGDLERGLLVDDEHKRRMELLDSITRTSQSDAECVNCPIASGCAWCSGYNYDRFGTPNKRATFICPMHKARVLANVYYWNKLYKKSESPVRFDINMPDEWALAIISQNELEELKGLANG